MPERMLSTRELNRALLARQLLLRRARLGVPRTVERIGALQAQWPPSPYVALWSRLEGFERAALTRAVERRRLVKATLMRATLHLVSADDYLAWAGIIRAARRGAMERRAERDGVLARADALVPRVLELTAGAPRTRPELLELLGQPKLTAGDARPWVLWHLLVARAELVHGPESSAWREHTSGARFAPARAWLGGNGGSGEAAVTALVRRYLGAFGPATRTDAAQWTGLPLRALAPGFAPPSLRRFRDEYGRELYDVPRAPLPAAASAAPVRLLPLWDSVLLAHADRTRILPAEYRSAVIERNGTVRQTFLVDGFVAGTWRFGRGRVDVEPFAPLPARVRRELDDEAARLAAFHA